MRNKPRTKPRNKPRKTNKGHQSKVPWLHMHTPVLGQTSKGR
jgi:hypothetical protein